MTSDLDKRGLEAAADAVYERGDLVHFEAELLAKAAVSAYSTQVASHRPAPMPDGLEVVGWRHPIAHWADHDLSKIAPHCRKDGCDGGPQPLVLKSAADARDAERIAEIARLLADVASAEKNQDLLTEIVAIWKDNATALKARVQELKAENAQLREALAPFAVIAESYADDEVKESYLDSATEEEVLAWLSYRALPENSGQRITSRDFWPWLKNRRMGVQAKSPPLPDRYWAINPGTGARKTFSIPEGYEAILDSEGWATSEVTEASLIAFYENAEVTITGTIHNLDRAILAAVKAACVATHRHVKTGGEYVLLGIGRMQAERWYRRHGIETATEVDMREVAIYRSVDDGSLWARPLEEFEDGRFEKI